MNWNFGDKVTNYVTEMYFEHFLWSFVVRLLFEFVKLKKI